jgi:hypothetical protein
MDKFGILGKAIFSFFPPQSPVDCFPIIAISFFVYKILKFFYTKSSIAGALESAILQLQQYKRNQGEDLETVQKISQAIHGDLLSPFWIEFKESLVVTTEGDRKKVRNTLDSEHFFNYQNICKKMDFFSSVPGILTGIAILGTFVGIIYGIHVSNISETIALDGNTAENVKKFQQSIGAFLASLGDAFGASVWGLALALVFTFIERKSASNVDELISNFNGRINMIFPRQTSEELLIRMVEDSQSQLSALNSISNDLPNKIVSCLTDGGISKVEINSTVQKGIQSGFEGLGRRLLELNEFHDKYFAEVKILFDNLKTVSDVLKDVTTINQALSSSSKVAADSLKLTSETIEKASAFNGNILEGFKTHTTHIEQTTEKFRTVGSEIGQMANTLSGASEHLLVEVKKSADAFSEQSRALVSTATSTSEGLRTGFKAIDEHMGSVVNQLGGAVGGLNTSLESLVEKLSDIEVRLNGKGDKAEFGKLAGDISILRQEIEKEKISKVG